MSTLFLAHTEADGSLAKAALEALAAKFEIPVHHLGTSGGDALVINDANIPLAELKEAHTATLPRLFG